MRRDQLLTEVFWSRVRGGALDACWEWTGTRNDAGYGRVWISGTGENRSRPAHRVAYELLRGAIEPSDMHLDHLCDNRACVNPWHLEQVTRLENMQRAARRGRMKTSTPRAAKPVGVVDTSSHYCRMLDKRWDPGVHVALPTNDLIWASSAEYSATSATDFWNELLRAATDR